MQPTFTTDRLTLHPLHSDDSTFIQHLVNTDGWIQFIGDRHVHTAADARAYVAKIQANMNVMYMVVRLKENEEPIGIVTIIQRDYLPHRDIGFAFLPVYAGKGYAFEAAQAVLDGMVAEDANVLATTLASNVNSIRLLEKLGLVFNREIEVAGETLLLYGL